MMTPTRPRTDRRTVLAAVLAFVAVTTGASDLRWYSHSTEHFTFIYRTEHRWAVDELASFADEVYDQITDLFGSSAGHVPVVVFGETDLANGYYSPVPPQHIGLYVVQPSLPWVGAKTESWLRLLLVHELTHYVQANYDRGLFRSVGAVLGRSLTGLSIALTAIWTTEGIAVNTESIYTSGGRGSDPFFEMLYKAPVVENRLFSLRQAGYDSHLAPRGRFYVAGYLIWDYLLDTYGPQIVREVFDSYARFPLLGIRGPIRRSTGERMPVIYESMTRAITARYAADPDMPDAPRVSPTIRADYYLPQPTERGLYLYRTRPDARPGVVRFDRETGRETPILEIRLTDHASWGVTADGSTIAFATIGIAEILPDEDALHSDIHLYDVTSGTTTRLTTGGGYYQPAIAPDGSFIVTIRREGGYHQLERIDLDAGEPIGRLLLRIDEGRFSSPTISPDAGTVAVVANQRGIQQILLVDAADGTYVRVPQPAGGAPWYPTFADEATLLFGHDAGGTLRLYAHDLESGEVRLIAEDPIGAYSGRLLPQELIYASYTSDGFTLRSTAYTHGQPVAAITAAGPTQLDPPPAVSGDRYLPWPAPVFWLPLPGIAGPGVALTGLGAGAVVYGSDILQRNSWQLAAVYFPALRQLDYAGFWGTRYARLTASAGAEGTYRVTGAGPVVHRRTLRHTATVSYLLHAVHRLGTTSRVSAVMGLTHTMAYESQHPFAAGTAGSERVELAEHGLTIGTGVEASRVPISSSRALNPPWERQAGLRVEAPLAAPDFLPRGVVGRAAARVNVPVGSRDHVIAIQPAVSLASDPSLARPYGLRGFAAAGEHPAPRDRGQFRLAVDYHSPLLLVDIPVLPSVGITGFGLTLFAEGTGSFDVAQPRLALNPALGLGAEAIAVVTFWTPIPIRVGAAIRIDPSDPAAFSPAEDLAVYIRSSLPAVNR